MCIRDSRSIRQYKPQAVNRDTMQIILDCGINAPNGHIPCNFCSTDTTGTFFNTVENLKIGEMTSQLSNHRFMDAG